jgi:hypothetical protein
VVLSSSAASGVDLIIGKDVARRLLCAVAAGKEDEGVGLLLNAKRYGPFLGGLGQCWAALWAEAGLLRPGRVSPLPSPFLFLFSVLNLLFKFQFDFCLFLQVLKY